MGWRSSWASWSEKITNAIFVHCLSIRSLCRLLCFFSFVLGCFSFLDGWRFFSKSSSSWDEVGSVSDNELPPRDSALQLLSSFGLGQAGSGWVEVPDLRGQFAFVSLASRPDISKEKTGEFYVYLTKAKKVLKVFSNVDYFFIMQGSALVSSKESTPDAIKVSFSRIKGEIWVRFFLMSQENIFSECNPESLFFPISLVQVKDKEASVEVQYLSSIGFQWSGKDTLLEQNNGLSRQYIYLLRGKTPEKSLHLDIGDCLFKEEQEWFVAPPGERTRGKIIFQLEEITDNRLLFSVWDLQGRVKRGIYLSKIQENIDMANIREIRLSAVRSPEHVVLQFKQSRIFVHVGDYLIIEGHSPDAISLRVANKDEQLHKPGLYLWVKWIGRIEGKWQVEIHVYSEMRSKFVSCIITDNGFGYNSNQESKNFISQANYLFSENLLFASFRNS